MDASTLRVAPTATIHVKNAAGEPLYEGEKPVTIVVHGPGSRAYGAYESRKAAREIKRLNDNEMKLTAQTAEERLAETAEDLASVTVSFDGLTYGDKTGPDLYEAVYGDAALGFITRQVTKALADWSVFKPVSAPS